MSSNSKAAKAGLGYIIGNYLLRGLSFFTVPIFTRLLTTSDYGIFNSFLAYESILFIILGFAIHSSYKNALYKYKDQFENYVSSTFVLIIISLFIWLIMFFLFSVQICDFLQLNKLSIYMLIIYSFSSAIITCANSYFALNYEVKKFVKLSSISAITNIILSILLIKTIFVNDSYLGRIIGTAIPSFVISIYIIYEQFKRAKPVINLGFWKWGLNYSMPIIPHGISQIILNQFDRIMILNMIGAAQSGLYSFAYTIYTIINVTTNSLGTAWEPWFYEKMNERKYDEIKLRSSQYILGITTFTICVMLVSPEIIKILGSKEYWDAIHCILPIVAAGFFSFLYTLPSGIEYFHGKTKYIALGTVGAAFVNIVLNYIFIDIYGYVAAAYTTLFTYFLYFILHYVISRKIFKTKVFSFKIICFSISMVLLMIVVVQSLINYLLIRFIFAIVIFLFALAYEEKQIGFLIQLNRKLRK